MNYSDELIGEFDADKRILHLTARSVIYIRTGMQLQELCSSVNDLIGKYASKERCFMIVDLSKFHIEPRLADIYGEKIWVIADKYLIHNGLARYGYQITRLTIQMGYRRIKAGEPNLFKTRQDAYDFIERLVAGHPQNQPISMPGGQ